MQVTDLEQDEKKVCVKANEEPGDKSFEGSESIRRIH